ALQSRAACRRPVEGRRQSVVADRLDEIGRDQDHELGLLALIALRLEQRAEDREISQHGELLQVASKPLLEKSGDGEGLSARHLDRRIGPAYDEARQVE